MIFLADDDNDDLEILREALLQFEYHGPIRTANNGRILLDLLYNRDIFNTPDVILLDLNMPLKDGFEALEEIKGNPELATIPVIVLTSSARAADEERCYALGCSRFYTKPNTIAEYGNLMRHVKSIVDSAAHQA